MTPLRLVINAIAIHPDRPDRVYLGTDDYGILISNDGGETYEPSNAGFINRQVRVVLADHTERNRIYAGVIFDSTARASRRHSGGSTSYVTGVAPAIRASVAYETKPGFGTSTSSPGSTKAWKIANSPSCVPAVTQISLFGSSGMPAASSLRSASEPAFGV